MQIEITERAAEQLRVLSGQEQLRLFLQYDNEGCGCAVNGVPNLLFIEAPPSYAATTESNGVVIAYLPFHAIYFEERMTIDYHSEKRSFSLKSAGQIYTNDLRVNGATVR